MISSRISKKRRHIDRLLTLVKRRAKSSKNTEEQYSYHLKYKLFNIQLVEKRRKAICLLRFGGSFGFFCLFGYVVKYVFMCGCSSNFIGCADPH